MSDVDAETLEKILDPSTNFVERRRAFEEAMTWARGEGWDACSGAYQEMHGPIDGPPKPDGMVIPERAAEELPEPGVWKMRTSRSSTATRPFRTDGISSQTSR
jgi:hypothetical protein